MNNMYEWQGIDQSGHKISGKEIADNAQKLTLVLQNRGIAILRIKKSLLPGRKQALKISSKEIVEWTRYMAILSQANVGLVNSLQMTVHEHQHPAFNKLMATLRKNIENGMGFAESLQLFPKYFDKIYCGLIQAGENSGTLEKMLEQLANYQEQMLNLRAKIVKALFYPATVAIVAIIVTAGLLIFVVPQFKNIFNNFNAQLPLFTQLVIQISGVLQIHAMKFILGIIVATVSYQYCISRFHWLKVRRDSLLLSLPVIGRLFNIGISAQWTRVLSTLLGAGLSLMDALQITEKTIPNQIIQMAMHEVIQRISAGSSFFQALSAHACFSLRITQMVNVGENSGQLVIMLGKIADIHQAILDRYIDYLSKWLEPMIMIVLSVITGSLIIAMYLPIFKLGAAL